MNNLNSVLLEGNMVREPQYQTAPNDSIICTFSVASYRYYKQADDFREEVNFFIVQAQGKLAENCKSLAFKGRGVRVVGRLKQERWTDGDGVNHARILIIAEHIEFKPNFKSEEVKAEEKVEA